MERLGVPLTLVCTVAVLTGCGGAPTSHALSGSANPWGEAWTKDPVGQVWAATGIPLCTKGHAPVTLTNIEPVGVNGQVRLDRILVQSGHWGELAFQQGAPPGSRPAQGFVISPSPCDAWPPRYQLIVLAHRTGRQGGSISSLRVHYRAGNADGVYTIPFTYVLCGKRGPPGPCKNR